MTKRHQGWFDENQSEIAEKEQGIYTNCVQMKTGIEQALLSKFENGDRTPPTETRIRLADFYGVSIDYILCRTDNPNLNKQKGKESGAVGYFPYKTGKPAFRTHGLAF